MSSVRRQVVVRADVPWSNSSVDDQGIDTATERLPQTPAGEALEKIVLEVLGDDRLDRGGKTSHFGVEVRSRIEAAFGVELSPEEILGAGSTGALLGLVERALASSFSDMFGDAPLTESSFLEVAVVEPIPQISREGQLVTSFGQQRLWLIEQLRPGTSEYVVPVAIRFTGPFRIDLLERALETVAARHEVLRTRIVTYDGVPVQRIDSVVRLDLKPVRCPLGEVREFIRQGTNQSFDLEKDQLFRVQLFDIGRDGFVLAFYFHHAIFDNWSAGVLVKELEASYEALSSGKPLLLPDLPVQYSDFAAWQRQETTGNALETELRFWRGQLDGLAPLEMPTDHPRPDRWDPIGNVLTIEVPSALVDSVLSLGSSHGATPFVSFLSAFQVMLARYGQTDDISVGVPVAGRTRSETEDLIGFFANTVVVRSVVKNELAFTSFLQNVKQTVEAAIAHQDLPFERVVAEMSPDRDLSRNPLCQVMFVVQNSGATDQHFGLGEARGEFLHVGNEAAKFDISWTMQSLESGGFSVDIVYSERLFDRSSIEHMTHQYLQLLRSIVDTPEEQLGKLRLVQPDDRSGSGQHPNFIAGSVSLSVVELFADSVARDPASVALIHGDEEMSYDELDRRSSKLAHHLRSVGVGPEVLVAVLLPRSAEVVVTWLAILKAGGAYVPLDPQHPTKRLSYVLEDTAAPVLITDTATRTHVPEYPGRVVVLEEVDFTRLSDSTPDVELLPDSLAYVIYTSGSTGQPKGVAITHNNIANRILWGIESQRLAKSDRLLHRSSSAFDAAGWEIYGPLASGAAAVIVPPAADRDAGVLVSEIRRLSVTVVQLVPSLLEVILELPELASCSTLRLVTCAGEALDVRTAATLRRVLGDVELINTYGPTECAIDVAFWRCANSDDGITPIGFPVANTHLVAVGDNLEVAPVLVPGELYIGGSQVGRGYWGRPALTAERFVPDAFSGIPGARVYRSGDLVRRRPDGALLFLGRLDQQVKVRGFRIELGEVEAAIATHPDVQAVAVNVHGVGADRGLAAYVVSANAAELDSVELRRHASARLPYYMVPAWWISVGTLPTTSSGKRDHLSLLAPDDSHSDAAAKFVEPRDTTEAFICAVWCEVLGLERVGANDDFFNIGGNSLQVLRAISRLRRDPKFSNVDLLRMMFDSATPAMISDEFARSAHRPDGPVFGPVSREGDLALSFAQERLWFLEELRPESSEYSVPVALRLRGRLDDRALELALTAVVARHEILRTRIEVTGGVPRQIIDELSALNLGYKDLSAENTNAFSEFCESELQKPFRLDSGPLLRAHLVRRGKDDHILLIVLHHSIFDGWSTAVLLRDLDAAYSSLSAGKSAALPDLPVQYADYAAWQREWLSGEVLGTELRYWEDQLEGLVPVELPTDHSRPEEWDSQGKTTVMVVPAELAKSVVEIGRRRGATPFMVFLSAFQVLLGRYAGTSDISVGTPVAGRGRAETDDLIGFFVNTLVMRTRLGNGITFNRLVDQVRETVLDALNHQDLPFERLVQALSPERDLSRNPLIQVMFVLQNIDTDTDGLRIGDLSGELVRVESDTAKFDLTWTLDERADGAYVLDVQYARSLFEEGTIERMAGHFIRLLESISNAPSSQVARLDLLTQDERARLTRFEPGNNADKVSLSVVELFADSVARDPASVALIHGDEEMSYDELDRRSSKLAHHLRSVGVGPEVLVAVLLPRSAEVVVTWLAILKAGGAYVPLDPQHPTKRLSYVLEDTAAPVLITDTATRTHVPEYPGRVVVLEEVDFTRLSDSTLDVELLPDSLAYVIYTSGSTGQPKGVAITHNNYVHHCQSVVSPYELMPGTKVLFLSGLTFDVSLDQMGGTLSVGATLVLGDPQTWGPDELLDRIFGNSIDTVEITPAHYREMMRQLRPNDHRISGVKVMNVGSDVVTYQDASIWSAAETSGRFLCNYGPTETTVTCTLYPVSESDLLGSSPSAIVPIGFPIGGTPMFVADAHQLLVPENIPGELLIGGLRTARGYWGRPALTAERFVPDAFSGIPGARVYRSGDLVRRRPDGALLFLGRLDQQVKVRGFRIELGEVEAAIATHPDVASVVVQTFGERGNLALVAYVIMAAGILELESLRAFMSTLVPDYMIPSRWVELDDLPLNPSGKVDKRALPKLTDVRPTLRQQAVAPRNHLESDLAEVWRELLAIEDLGVMDDFFDLGGHSLLATRLIARLNIMFGLHLPLRLVFDVSTVAGLAEEVTNALIAEVADLDDAQVQMRLDEA